MTCVKRPIGFLGALVALILLSPLFICTIVFLHFANKGAGVFFTQDRPGKNEKIFKALKFKTMTDEREGRYGLHRTTSATGAVPPTLQRGAAQTSRCNSRHERLGTGERPQQHQLAEEV